MSSVHVRSRRVSHRGRFAGLLVAAMVVVAGCGSGGSSDDSARADDAVTTTAPADAATDTTTADQDADGDEGDAADAEELIGFDDAFCASIPADAFADSVGGSITDARAMGGMGFQDDVEYETSSCTFDLDDGSEVVVSMLLDPDTSSPLDTDLFDRLHASSEADTMSGYEHADVDGIGDQAVFLADAFDNLLMVSDQGMVFTFSGKDADFESLDRPVVEQIATAALSQTTG